MQTSQNQALFSLIGTRFGGNTQAFKLPDLRGRTMTGFGDASLMGVSAGVETVVLTYETMPAHRHMVCATTLAGNKVPAKACVPATPGQSLTSTIPIYRSVTNTLQTIRPDTVMSTGGDGAHNNMQPSLVVNYCIAIAGLYPARS